MTYTENAGSTEADRIWTERIPGHILVAEYDDGDYVIYNEVTELGLLLEPQQMQTLLDFYDIVREWKEVSLGENCLYNRLTVCYRAGTYTFNPAPQEIWPTLAGRQMDIIYDLVKKTDR